MINVRKDGSNKRVFILLHGTGGSADSLFDIASYIDKDATLIGLQGEVMENGMRRYFERYPDGTFKLKSLAKATSDVYDTLKEILKDFEGYEVVMMGYSNGANVMQSLLKTYEDIGLDYAVLYHPSETLVDEPFKVQDNLKVLVTSGKNDPFISDDQLNNMLSDLRNSGYITSEVNHDYGHQLIHDELEKTKEFIGV